MKGLLCALPISLALAVLHYKAAERVGGRQYYILTLPSGEAVMTAGNISFAFRADRTRYWRFHESKFDAKTWLCYNESEFIEGSQVLELIYKNVALGKIVVTNREDFWISGEFYPYPSASEFEDFLMH